MKKKSKPSQVKNSGPINLPTRTLLLIGILFVIVALSMLLFPSYWFSGFGF